jgi:hypothetical protein
MRKNVLKSFLATAAALSCAVLIVQFSGCGGPLDAEGVMNKSVKALGGLEKATGWKTSASKGLLKATWPGWGDLQANCTYLIEKPDKMVLDQDYSAYDHPFFFRYTYNTGEAWVNVNLQIRQSPRYTTMLEKGLRTVDGIAYYLEHSDTLYIVAEVEPDSILTGVDFTRVAAIEGADTVYFDVDNSTWLPARAIDKGDQGEWNHNIYDDYRSVNGYMVPFHEVVYTNGSKSREMTWSSIEFDVEIDGAEFEKDRPAPAQE